MIQFSFKPDQSALRAALGAIILAGAPSAAMAEEWTGQVTLYGWGAGVSGDFTPFTGAPTVAFDKSLSEVLEDLDAAFFVTGLARRGDFVVLGDFTYSSSSRSGLVPPGVPASGEVSIRSLSLAAGRRFHYEGGATVDVLAGLRAWRLEGSVSAPAAGVSQAPEASFTDPILAVRANAPLSERWSLLGYGDLGGFGVGSDFTWQVVATANFQLTEAVYLSAGWRHLHLDYSSRGTVFDGAMSGPVIGATLRF